MATTVPTIKLKNSHRIDQGKIPKINKPRAWKKSQINECRICLFLREFKVSKGSKKFLVATKNGAFF